MCNWRALPRTTLATPYSYTLTLLHQLHLAAEDLRQNVTLPKYVSALVDPGIRAIFFKIQYRAWKL